MTKVYIITRGQYSNYAIEAVFSTEKLAEQFVADAGWGKYANIEVWDIDMPVEQWAMTIVRMDRHGDTETETSYEQVYRGNLGFGCYSYDDKWMMARITSVDVVRAVKVVNEWRAQVLAAGCWGNVKATQRLLKGK